MLKTVILILLQASLIFPASGWGFRKKNKSKTEEPTSAPQKTIPEDLQILMDSYPDLKIQAEFNDEKKDWIISFENYGTQQAFHWAEGSVLPEEELINKENYWHVVYKYSNELRDPKTFTEEEIERLREYGTVKNRKKAPGTPMFFFDAVYASYTRAKIEPHIITIKFLGKGTRVHERILEPLKRVEAKILEAEKKSPEVRTFIKELKSAAAYNWRQIDGTKRKSFHSLGIAVDLLPVAYHGGEVFWSWARDKNPERWMMTSIKGRWMPPKEVVDAFESEGFIWGGYWAIWDNMHFEYHPELIGKMKASASTH
ncbi:MAG: M15 family metallopeptidase [Spirochaetales bacterium]|nr:M15 family metallopeptidase [Spirochaetales bacterium]